MIVLGMESGAIRLYEGEQGMSSDTPPAKLHWSTYGGRMGWWLTLPDGKLWDVHGPSICESSGGGAQRALGVVRSALAFDGEVEIGAAEHNRFQGGRCVSAKCYGVE